MKAGSFTFYSFVTQPLLTTILAGLLNATTPVDHSDFVLQEPAVTHGAGIPSASTEVAPDTRSKPPKLRKWSGSLVDAGCTTNALRQIPSIDQTLFADPLSKFWQTLDATVRVASIEIKGRIPTSRALLKSDSGR